MTDLTLSAVLSRSLLGLAPLDMNDGIAYRAGLQFLGGTVDYERTTADSPYLDGSRTTHRRKTMVTEPVQVEIRGRNAANDPLSIAVMRQKHDDLVAAIEQDNFTLTVTIDGTVWKYQCEASGYQMAWQGPRFMARQGQLTIQLMRQPNPLIGRT